MAVAIASLSAPVLAGRPLQTDDAGVLERGACEVEAFAARLHASVGSARERSLQLGCGLGRSTQLALAFATERAPAAREQQWALAGKTALWRGESPAGADAPDAPDAPALTLAYALDYARESGQRWRHAGSKLNLIYSRGLAADLTLHANLGHGRDEASAVRTTSWGLALEHSGWGPVAPMAELFGDDRERPWWNLGLRWALRPGQSFIDLSYGRQVASGRPRLLTIGCKFGF